MRMCDLASSVILSRSGLTRLVDRLQRDGLLVRESCASDARGQFAKLTPAGHEARRRPRDASRRRAVALPRASDGRGARRARRRLGSRAARCGRGGRYRRLRLLTADAAFRVAPCGPARAAHLSPWGRLVAACAFVVLLAAAVLLIWSLTSTQRREVSYSVRGAIGGVALDLGDADVVIRGGGRATAVSVQHVDHFGFGHGPTADRAIAGGVFSVRSRCPSTILHGCSVRYRVVVPDNIPLSVRTAGGSVRFRDYRGSARSGWAAGTSTSPASAGSRCRRAPTAVVMSPPGRLPAIAAGAAHDDGRRPRAGASGPLPRRRVDLGRGRDAAGAGRDDRRGRAVLDPSAEQLGPCDRRAWTVIATLRLQERVTRAGQAMRVPRRVGADCAARRARGPVAGRGCGAERRRDRVAAADRRGGRVPTAGAAGPPRGQPLPRRARSRR